MVVFHELGDGVVECSICGNRWRKRVDNPKQCIRCHKVAGNHAKVWTKERKGRYR